ncbi:UNVERIFIED_CONTAM: hypothetical protein HDU68_007742, partial [Siphonaria sp. JEL0065]
MVEIPETNKAVERQQSHLEYSFPSLKNLKTTSNPSLSQTVRSNSRLVIVEPSKKQSLSRQPSFTTTNPSELPTLTRRGSFARNNVSETVTRHERLVAHTSTQGLVTLNCSPSLAVLATNKSNKAKKRWKWALARVKQIVKASHAANDLSAFESLGLGAAHLNPNGNNAKGLISGFDSNSFKITTKPGGSDRVMAALIKNPEDRNIDDLRMLDVLLRNLPLFSKYSPAVVSGLAKVVEYSRFGPHRNIIKEGHRGWNFYYIMTGDLEVTKMIEGRSSCVRVLKAGMIFGELALLLENSKRTATVSTNTDTELLWLSRHDFEAVLKRETSQEVDDRKRFLASHPFFETLGAAAVNHLALTAQTIELKPGQMIFSEGEVPDCVYLICEGEAKVTKCIQLAKVKLAKRGTRFKLYPFPLPPSITAPFGMQITPELVHVTNVSAGEYYGAAAALATGGNPSQIATLKSFFNINMEAQSPFSLVASTRVKYISLNKYSFAKELKRFPEILESIAK